MNRFLNQCLKQFNRIGIRYTSGLFFVVSGFGAGFTAQADCYIRSNYIPANVRENHGTLSCSAGPVIALGTPITVFVRNTVFATDTSGGADSFLLNVEKAMHGPDTDGARGGFHSLITFQRTLTTAGPERMGLIAYTLLPGDRCGACSDAVDFQEWLVGPYGGYSTGRNDSLYRGQGSFLLPFLLGAPFNVSMSSDANDNSGDSGSVSGRSFLEFRLYEADGKTLVRILETPNLVESPEPGTFILTGIAALALLAGKRAGPTQKA